MQLRKDTYCVLFLFFAQYYDVSLLSIKNDGMKKSCKISVLSVCCPGNHIFLRKFETTLLLWCDYKHLFQFCCCCVCVRYWREFAR